MAKNLNAVTTLVSKYNADIQAVNLQGTKKKMLLVIIFLWPLETYLSTHTEGPHDRSQEVIKTLKYIFF